ncbi:MAG: bifunctional pyr operon transcriptional regulator/uracil phosphoribosyltransferase PyrR [Actinomycetia bacterium]|nr:bifunctional pyr operon transcriptional regulator/uracil phosphoribosyltransferase PyrR [Actinomycetes bacterium]
MTETVKATILDAADVQRTLVRIAHEILEAAGGAKDLALVGIVTRGDVLAHKLADIIASIEGAEVPVGTLDISLYRDDIGTKLSPVLMRTEVDFPLEEKTVVLVDDVLYTGRTIRAALDALMDLGRPRCIRLAVLVDRGHRELPIRADFVGKNVPSAYQEKVRVSIRPFDEVDSVEILEAGEGA